MSGVAHSSYSRRGILCNGLFAHALDRLPGEALSREIAGRAQPPPPLRGDALRTSELGIERGQGRLDVFFSDATCLEVLPDQEVARTAPRQQLGTPSGDPCVVNRPGTHQSLDRVLPHVRRDIRSGKPI